MSDENGREDVDAPEGAQVAFDESLLEALSEGALSDASRGLMGVLAHGDEALELQLEAHRPLGEGFESKLTEQLLWRGRQARRRRRLLGWTGAGATMIAAAAAFLLVVRTPEQDSMLPEYVMQLSDGVATHRGATNTAEEGERVPRFLPRTRLVLTLVPVQRVDAVPPHQAFLGRDGGPLRVWPVEFEQAQGGALRLTGFAEELFPGPGRYDVVVVWGDAVGPEEAMSLMKGMSPRALSAALRYDPR